MPRVCPSCERSLADESDVKYCMYCGARLIDTRIHGLAELDDSEAQSPTLILEPVSDSDLTADYRTASATPPTATEVATPVRVGIYRLLRKLGTGGMGQVFEAESDEGGERVALKLLSPKLVTNPTSVERFKQEGRLASQISHPRCVFVYGVDAEDGRPFIVMELMPGSTLKDLVDQRGPLAWDRAIHRMLDVLDGLIEAHRLGMLHRDVKPSNCFLTDDDRVKIGDFGLSKSLDGQGQQQKQLTSSGAFLGTVLFASPEQIRGEELGYDSDVYSVAATLYFLIVGRAPHHHISMTAALAKVISEPPPSIRSQKPDVPKTIERVVFRGLERDRNRRFGSLEEFRDALHDVLPERQLPSRMRTLVSAYLLDVVFCLICLATPTTWLYESLAPHTAHASDWVILLVTFLYFTVAEGVFGVTIGKLLFRLRATKLGRVGPPGLRAAVVRTGVFHILAVGLFLVTVWTFAIPVVGAFVAGMVFLAGSAGLFFQRRYSPTRQGLHDYAAGSRVVQKSRPQHRPWLTSQFRNPLDQPKTYPNLPASVGGFQILGVLGPLPDGAAVWVAEDEALRRRILLWLRPAKLLPDGLPPSPVRPGRLRVISTGELIWNDGAYGWVAFVAPTGAPLIDVVTKEAPLSWADARMVLEQVVAELRDSEADATTPARLGVDQLWVEPNGRVHLLEFPVPSVKTPTPLAGDPLELVRHVAAVTLEGEIQPAATRIASPLSPQATRIIDSLFAASPPTLVAVRQQLKDNHAHPPEVGGGMRAAHVGLILAISGWALVLMLLGSIGFSVQIALDAAQGAQDTIDTLAGLSSPQQVEQWRAADPYLKDVLAAELLPTIRENLQTQHARDEQLWQTQRDLLSRPERFAADSITRVARPLSSGIDDPAFTKRAVKQIMLASLPPQQREVLDREARRLAAWQVIAFILGVALVFTAFAFAFHGGASYLLAGIALVRRDGRAASRWACAAREFLMWLPLLFVLILNIGIQAYHPDWVYVRLGSAGLTVAMLIGYLFVGLRYPNRGPHDELVGTYMVPA